MSDHLFIRLDDLLAQAEEVERCADCVGGLGVHVDVDPVVWSVVQIHTTPCVKAPARLLRLMPQMSAGEASCPGCGAAYGPPEDHGYTAVSDGCQPPTSDEIIEGHALDIPAWCGERGAFVWRGPDGQTEADR